MSAANEGPAILRGRVTLTTREAADLLGVSIREVRSYVAHGLVEAYRPTATRLLISAPSLVRFLESNRLPCRPEARVSNAKGGAR